MSIKGHLPFSLVVVLCCGSVASLAAGGTPEGAPCLAYGPASTVLTGRLQLESRFGPPNYGEDPLTDKKVMVPMLHLVSAVDVCAERGDEINVHTYRGIWVVQLAPADSVDPQLAGKNVRVVGQLYEAQFAHDYTRVTLTVDSIVAVFDPTGVHPM